MTFDGRRMFKIGSKIRLNILFILMFLVNILLPLSADADETGMGGLFSLDLLYLDELNGPPIFDARRHDDSDGKGGASEADQAGVGPRTFGLWRASWDFQAYERNFSKLNFRLRPDALTQRRLPDGKMEDGVDVDTRAGTVYRPLPPIHFLDTYEVELVQSPSLSWAIGVKDSLAHELRRFPPPQAFGLEVQLPRKLNAVSVNWEVRSPVPPGQELISDQRWNFAIVAAEGRGDRGVSLGDSSKSFDRGMVAQDPYRGLALLVNRKLGQDSELGLTVGSMEQGLAGGKILEQFCQVFGQVYRGKVIGVDQVGFDFRYSVENWRNFDLDFTPLRQESISAFVRKNFSENWNGLGAFGWGRSERHESLENGRMTPYFGWQLESGVEYSSGRYLSVSATASHENRKKQLEDGTSIGAFGSGKGQTHVLSRMALLVSYQLGNSNI